MNKKSMLWSLVSLMVLASMILAACGGTATEAPAVDEGSHPAPPFFRNPLDGYLWLLVNISLLRVTCQAV